MINKFIKIFGLSIIVLGLLLSIASLMYNRYTNENEFQEKLLALDDSGGDNSEQYFKLREEYLTPKFVLENYGITSIILGSIILVISIIGVSKVKTPKTNIGIIMLGLLAALLTNLGNVGDLFLEGYRESSPPWADSLGIPLMSIPLFFIISIGWVILNLIGMKGNFQTNINIFPIKFKHLNIWYSILIVISIIITVWLIIYGSFWLILPGFLWIYFYISLMLGIRESKLNEDETIID